MVIGDDDEEANRPCAFISEWKAAGIKLREEVHRKSATTTSFNKVVHDTQLPQLYGDSSPNHIYLDLG